jgi:hypothetical protein
MGQLSRGLGLVFLVFTIWRMRQIFVDLDSHESSWPKTARKATALSIRIRSLRCSASAVRAFPPGLGALSESEPPWHFARPNLRNPENMRTDISMESNRNKGFKDILRRAPTSAITRAHFTQNPPNDRLSSIPSVGSFDIICQCNILYCS